MKALRFHLIGVVGKVVSHARTIFLKLTEGYRGLIPYREARSQLLVFSSAERFSVLTLTGIEAKPRNRGSMESFVSNAAKVAFAMI